MVLRFSILAVVFLLACTGVERDNPYDEKRINYGEVDCSRYDYNVKEIGFIFTDPRDKNVYKAVELNIRKWCLDKNGNIIEGDNDDSVHSINWMTQNLNFKTTSGSTCYDNEETNCTTYGRLYDFETAKTACPDGWRLPIIGEENDFNGDVSHYVTKALGLERCYDYVKIDGGGSLCSNDRWLGLSGFGSDGSFSDIDTVGYWWTSTEGGNGYAYSLHGALTGITIYKFPSDTVIYISGELKKSADDKSYFLSVRCIQDLE